VEHAYATLSGGATSVQTRCLNGRDDCALSSSGGRLLGGFYVNPGLAAEIVYMDFGRGRQDRLADTQQVGLRMAGIGAAAQLELGGGLAFTARGGLAGMRMVRDSTVGGLRSVVTQNSAEFYGGLSAMFRLNKTLAIEASLDVLGLGDSSYRRDSGVMGSLGLSLRY
jgi:hypothetical protein